MRQFYDMLLLALFIVIVCVFMVCCQKRTQRLNERNAKIFEMRAASPGDTELEYEDIQSSDMDNDNNDDIELIEKQKRLKSKMERNKKRNHQNIAIEVGARANENKSNNELEENKADDVFSSTDDEMSMERMREEYYKSQTLTKKFTDLLDDIRDILKSKQKEVQSKFTKKKQMIVIPMAMPAQSISTNNNNNNNNDNNDTIGKNITTKSKKKSKKKKRDKSVSGKNNKNGNDSVESECDEKVREEDD